MTSVIRPRPLVLRSGPYDQQPVTVAARRRANEPSNMLTCAALNQWNTEEADNYQGLRVARSINKDHWQPLADDLHHHLQKERMAADGPKDDTLQKQIVLFIVGEEASLPSRLQSAAQKLSNGLPPALAKFVSADAQAMADTMHKMVPDAQSLEMKLELFGERVCSRWHEDNYIARSIVSYNCSATQYTANSNVDYNELYFCGNNDHIIRDKSRIKSVNVGDIVMIKGAQFPGKARSLVHKSPEVEYYDSGDVRARIVLKVDMLPLEEY